jgi:hypothetical protein
VKTLLFVIQSKNSLYFTKDAEPVADVTQENLVVHELAVHFLVVVFNPCWPFKLHKSFAFF